MLQSFFSRLQYCIACRQHFAVFIYHINGVKLHANLALLVARSPFSQATIPRMQRLLQILIVLLLGIAPMHAALASSVELLLCTVVRITDGDTAKFQCDGWNKIERVRITGYNAPDRCQPGYHAATEWLRTTLATGKITLRVRALDKYERLVADVFVNGKRLKAPREHRAKRKRC